MMGWGTRNFERVYAAQFSSSNWASGLVESVEMGIKFEQSVSTFNKAALFLGGDLRKLVTLWFVQFLCNHLLFGPVSF